jgi:hypothetical protein
MARYNEILVGRYNRFLQKLLVVKGGPPAAQLASEIQPVIPLFHGIENRNLEGWDLFATYSAFAGVAAQNTTLQINNPTTSNVVAVFEKMNFFVPATDQITLRKGPGAVLLLPQLVGAVMREDPRGRQTASILFSTNDAGHVPTLVQNFAGVLAGPAVMGEFIKTHNQEIALMPGDMIQISVNTVGATQLTGGVKWRERFLEDSERT